MISFLHPVFLYAALAAAAGIIALHFIITEQPKTGVLPTVRFFPDVPARASTLAMRLTDVLLLALRVTTVILIGAAFAQPVLSVDRTRTARVVVVDIASASSNARALTDSARVYLADAAAVVLVDSVAREVDPESAADAIVNASRPAAMKNASHASANAPGQISAALVASLRAASRLRESADSVEIVLVSPLLPGSVDAATLAIRDKFPGRVHLVRTPAPASATASGVAQLEWADSARSAGWVSRTLVDTIAAVGDARVGVGSGAGSAGAAGAAGTVLVHPFARLWEAASSLPAGTQVIARWADGEPAALEWPKGDACTRSVAFSSPSSGDVALRPEFVAFAARMRAPCGAFATASALSPSFLRRLSGPSNAAPASSLAPRVIRMTPLVRWLLAGALLLALTELLVRRVK